MLQYLGCLFLGLPLLILWCSLSNYKLDYRVHTSVVAKFYISNFGNKACKHLVLNRLGISYFRGNVEGVLGKLYVLETWIAQVAQY